MGFLKENHTEETDNSNEIQEKQSTNIVEKSV